MNVRNCARTAEAASIRDPFQGIGSIFRHTPGDLDSYRLYLIGKRCLNFLLSHIYH